ncbi:unnamed protein product [Spirodela intermedia]|uniref:RING-CH-type domain-containing protein n=1 Tax=Spirodela intermedia TaxID=51605 RepID=A0A7I8JNX4_SPIIN|nr:unnamed protein product [Spirodela intermedia]CAA6671800.1 unnamed protein product [Spirodela intermedia]
MERSEGALSRPGWRRPDQASGRWAASQDGGSGREIQPILHSRRPKLPTLEIPARSLEGQMPVSSRVSNPLASTPNSLRAGLPPRPNSAKAKPSTRNLLPQRSLRAKTPTPECERVGLLGSAAPMSDFSQDKPSTSRPFSLTRVFSSTMGKGTHSMPVTPVSGSGLVSVQGSHVVDLSGLEKPMIRSMSVPSNVKGGSLHRMNSLGGRFRIVQATPSPVVVDAPSADDSTTKTAGDSAEDDGQDIPEEEAVCRICFIELAEGGESLKMECSCRGELALAHQECAVKWFSIKGNKTCDICKQEVKNLPFWQDVPVLAMVSMLAYFCFLEQLLVTDMGSRALAVSLPFSCALGFLSSAIASTIVIKSYVWAYASFQFALVILFSYVYYNMLKMTPVLSILLSSLTGFGIAICTNSLAVEFLRWKERRTPLTIQQSHGANEGAEAADGAGLRERGNHGQQDHSSGQG